MPQLAWAAPTTAMLVLCSVYLWSRDEGRRARALRLLRLILGRRLASRLEDTNND
jgi:hypothetical protein